MLIAKRSFEAVAKFRYLEKAPIDTNCMKEGIRSGLNSENVY
jgi:hypothetical protein